MKNWFIAIAVSSTVAGNLKKHELAQEPMFLLVLSLWSYKD